MGFAIDFCKCIFGQLFYVYAKLRTLFESFAFDLKNKKFQDGDSSVNHWWKTD